MIVNSIPVLAISFLLGVVSLQLQATLPSAYWAVLLIPALVLAISFQKSHWLLFLLAGFFWSALFGWSYLQAVPDVSIAGQNIRIIGVVSSLPIKREKATKFRFDIDEFEVPGYSGGVPKSIRLSWYYPKSEIKAGERWQFLVRLKPPNGFQNPGGFDYEAWLYQQGIHASGYVRKSQFNKKLESPAWHSALNQIRSLIRDQINSSSSPDMAALLNALAIGYRGDISPDSWRVFIRTGTNHLIAISGLHIGLVAGFSWFFLRLLSRLRPIGRVLNQRKLLVLSFSVAITYAAMANFTIPTQRALIMLGVVYLAVYFNRQITVSQTLSIALIAVLLYSPASVLSAGFWLSFLAVAAISYSLRGRLPGRNKAVMWMWPQVVVIIALIPIGFYFFQQSSVIALLANVMAIPVVSMLILPLLLMSLLAQLISPELSAVGVLLSAEILSTLLQVLEWLSEFEWSVWVHAQPSILSLIFAMLGLMLLFAPFGVPARWLSAILFLPLLTSKAELLPVKSFELHVLDVGQGLSVFIQTRHHQLLFDTGARFSQHFDAGERVVVPFLRQSGVSQIDKLIISNGDRDHIGGAESVIKNIEVKEVLGRDIENLEHLNKSLCKRGQKWQWDEVSFEIMHPEHQNYRKRNNYSCVLRVSNQKASVLIAADVEQKAESELSLQYSDLLRSDVLIVPHHGSKTSSGTVFLENVDPDIAIYSSGYLNRYRFPRPEVVERYSALSIEQLNTAESGHIGLRFDQSGLENGPTGYRKQYSRYWHRASNND